MFVAAGVPGLGRGAPGDVPEPPAHGEGEGEEAGGLPEGAGESRPRVSETQHHQVGPAGGARWGTLGRQEEPTEGHMFHYFAHAVGVGVGPLDLQSYALPLRYTVL